MNQSDMSPDELKELASKLRIEVDIVLNKLLANFFNGCLFDLLDCIIFCKQDDRMHIYYDADAVFEHIATFKYIKADDKIMIGVNMAGGQDHILVKKWGKK